MSAFAEEAVRLIETLPEDKACALLEFARYLAEKSDEEEWERKSADPHYRPKLTAMIEEVEQEIATGRTTPLDLDRP
jgi:TorA maturation chaperone TorD